MKSGKVRSKFSLVIMLVKTFLIAGCQSCFGPLPSTATTPPPTPEPSGNGGTLVPPTITMSPSYATFATQPVPTGSCGQNAYGGLQGLTRLIGGSTARPYEIPWQVRLEIKQDTKTFLCGGAIISNEWVITAAHCLLNGSTINVVAGAHSMSTTDINGVTQSKAYFTSKHPRFNEATGDYDIGLVLLETPFVYTNRIQPICVPRTCAADCTTGNEAIISGWGTTAAAGSTPASLLQKGSVSLVSSATCQQGFQSNNINRVVTSQMVCAGKADGSVDTCRGDDGGPLSCKLDDDRFYLSGVKSFVDKCGSPGIYSVYTRPCSVISWIDAVTNYVLTSNSPLTSPRAKTTANPTTQSTEGTTEPPFITQTAKATTATTQSATTAATQATTPPINGWVNDPDCGKSKYNDAGISSRIVGGAPARPNEFPWQVRVMTTVGGYGTYLCGGSLINSEWVLTAGHCIASSDTAGGKSVIYLGGQRSDQASPGEISIAASQEIPHPQYDDDSHDYDFALLKLSRKVTFNDTIRPVCLLPGTCVGETAAGTKCSISGWGTLTEGSGSASPTLQKASVPLQLRTECQRAFTAGGYGASVTARMVCAGDLAGGIDTCQGDSGGPLACINNSTNQFYLNGVTSFGFGCARQGTYGIYGRPCSVMSWILTTLGVNRRLGQRTGG